MDVVLKKLSEEQSTIRDNIQHLDESLKYLLDCARDVGEVRRSGHAEEAAKGEKQLRAAFTKYVKSRHALEEYLRASEAARAELVRFGEEHMDQIDEENEEVQLALEKLLRHISEDMARFASIADDVDSVRVNVEADPNYRLFLSKLSVCIAPLNGVCLHL